MKVERSRYRVVKTLKPTDPGAIGWARRYGEALICVRHRTDGRGKVRHTTVELLIESTPIQPRTTRLVHLKIAPHERSLHAICKAAGGHWDSKSRTWRLPQRVAGILNLRSRIVPT
jgi:hypothetical protein